MPGRTYFGWGQNYAACSGALRCISGRLKVRVQLPNSLPGEAAVACRSKCIHFLANNERKHLSLHCAFKLNSVALVRERTIPTERPPPVGEVSANFCG